MKKLKQHDLYIDNPVTNGKSYAEAAFIGTCFHIMHKINIVPLKTRNDICERMNSVMEYYKIQIEKARAKERKKVMTLMILGFVIAIAALGYLIWSTNIK